MLFFTMADVVVYSTNACGYCVRAKALLSKLGIKYEEVDVSGDSDKRAWLVKETGRRTVPQIFIKGKAIGGFDDLAALNSRGELIALTEG
jgi:glutaredoxin 3